MSRTQDDGLGDGKFFVAAVVTAFLDEFFSGGQRLSNGTTVIARYASQRPIRIFEVTPEKKFAWTQTGPHRAHEIQILTTNGKPLEGTSMK